MPKKRKLNSTNPKYLKKEEKTNVRRQFVKEVKGVKIYKII
tara:strand:- start:214 stop:336 length:123 start_codon:yes stop_codon:yes gene_type:complete